MLPDDETPSVAQIKANLIKALEAERKGPDAFRKAFDEMFPVKKEPLQMPECGEDRPRFR